MTSRTRAVVGLIVALGMLGLVPGTVFAAQPVCGQVLMANTTLTGDLDCSAVNSDGLRLGKDGIVLDLNGYTIIGFAGAGDDRGAYPIDVNHTKVKNGTIRDFD